MTRRLDCIAEGCDASIEAGGDGEILEQAAEHASRAHPDLDPNDELVEELKSHIVTV
jgi:predicted small metal-binding protein